jgi:elongation factor 1-beta
MSKEWKSINNNKTLAEFNTFLADKSYVSGYTPSQADIAAFKECTNDVNPKSYPHVARWRKHIASFSCERISKLSHSEKKEVKETKKVEKKEGKEEVADPFGESTEVADPFGENAGSTEEVETEEEKKRQASIDAIAAKKAEADKAKGKKKELARSQVIIDCKPLDDETDLAKLEARVRAIEIDGLVWLGAEKVPIGYGLKKLRIICNIIDDKVPTTDDITDKIIAFEDMVQSADLFAHNKL